MDRFNPRAPCGARPVHRPNGPFSRMFQSTRPVRGATLCVIDRVFDNVSFNPRAPCGARPTRRLQSHRYFWCFNPRAPCGARHDAGVYKGRFCCFNPRAPCGARRALKAGVVASNAVSIHAPRAGRDKPFDTPVRVRHTFQSTRPVRGATLAIRANKPNKNGFNPRAPCGARRVLPPQAPLQYAVSIHAPRAGRDVVRL